MTAILGSRGGQGRGNAPGAFKRIRTPSGSLTGNQRPTDESDEEDDTMLRYANYGSMVVFVLIVLVFNIVFWVIGLKEFNMDTEQILEMKKPIR